MNVETVYLKINKIMKPIDKLSPKTPPASFKIHHFLHDIFTGKNAPSTCQLFDLELHIESRGGMADRHDEDPPTTPVLAIQSSCFKLQQLYLERATKCQRSWAEVGVLQNCCNFFCCSSLLLAALLYPIPQCKPGRSSLMYNTSNNNNKQLPQRRRRILHHRG